MSQATIDRDGLLEGIARPSCPMCGAPMTPRRRRDDQEPFWGCSTFPKCYGGRHGDDDCVTGLKRIEVEHKKSLVAEYEEGYRQAMKDALHTFREVLGQPLVQPPNTVLDNLSLNRATEELRKDYEQLMSLQKARETVDTPKKATKVKTTHQRVYKDLLASEPENDSIGESDLEPEDMDLRSMVEKIIRQEVREALAEPGEVRLRTDLHTRDLQATKMALREAGVRSNIGLKGGAYHSMSRMKKHVLDAAEIEAASFAAETIVTVTKEALGDAWPSALNTPAGYRATLVFLPWAINTLFEAFSDTLPMSDFICEFTDRAMAGVTREALHDARKFMVPYIKQLVQAALSTKMKGLDEAKARAFLGEAAGEQVYSSRESLKEKVSRE